MGRVGSQDLAVADPKGERHDRGEPTQATSTADLAQASFAWSGVVDLGGSPFGRVVGKGGGLSE